VRELTVVTSRAIGTHRFFIAKVVEDQKISDGLAFCSIHGFYRYSRLKHLTNRNFVLAGLRARDAFHKREGHSTKP
jgi:hypothetical protein